MTINITYVIPCYNEARYIAGCIESIHKQENTQYTFDIIVVDNGSTDGTDEIAEKFGAIVMLNNRRGAASSRNLGARHAKGDIIAFVDADCILDPLWLSRLTRHLAMPSICAVAAPAIPSRKGITWVEKAWSTVFVSQNMRLGASLITVTNIASSNMLIKRACFDAVNGFDESLMSCEDYDLSQRLLQYGDLLLDKSINVTHLRESKTLMELFIREMKRGEYSVRCYKKNGYKLSESPSVIVPVVYNMAILMLITAIIIGLKTIIIMSALIIMTMPTIYLMRAKNLADSFIVNLQWYVVSSTYLLARSISLIKELYVIITK